MFSSHYMSTQIFVMRAIEYNKAFGFIKTNLSGKKP